MKLKLIFLATILIGIQACKQQCQQADIHLGTHLLTEEGKSYFPYNRKGPSSIILKNQNGDSMVFKNDLACTLVQSAQADSTLCYAHPLDHAYVLHNAEFLFSTYWTAKVDSEYVSFGVRAASIVVNITKKTFADQLEFSMDTLIHNRGHVGSVYFLVFHDPITNQHQINSEGGRLVADTMLNGKKFKNVVIAPKDRFFMARDHGLVAFKHRGQFWYLDAIR